MPDTPKKIDWPKAAVLLQKRVGNGSIETSVLACLRQIPSGNILVACSGGADSVFMLCILFARAEELGLKIHLAHYNHRWRGDESDADAAFVQSLAKAFDLPYRTATRPSNEAAFTETTARALRLDFLRQAAEHFHCDYILFGHQLDDIIETQLQRIARGCASDGLAAPRPVSRFDAYPTHLRPLLHLRAGDVRMALNSTSIPWCEDRSNDDLSIARNALRQQIIPDLAESLGRDPSLGAARSRRLLEEDAAALDALARERLPEAYAHARTLERSKLRSVPSALLRRALLEWLSGHKLIASVGAPAMDILLETLRSERTHYRMSAGAYYILIDADTLSWEHEDALHPKDRLQSATLEPGEPVILSTGALIAAELISLDADVRQRIEGGAVDPAHEAILTSSGESAYQLRGWEPGDRFCPLGAPGSKKLKDWFIDRQIPQAERKNLPLVINAAGEVIWVPGFPPADSCKIRPSTKVALRLTYQTRNSL